MENTIITIENYNGKTLTFTVPEYATVDIWRIKEPRGRKKQILTNVTIEIMCEDGIDSREE